MTGSLEEKETGESAFQIALFNKPFPKLGAFDSEHSYVLAGLTFERLMYILEDSPLRKTRLKSDDIDTRFIALL
jgi:hypothetical protein